MNRYPIDTPGSAESDPALEASLGDAMSADAGVMFAEALVHHHGLVPSLTALDALMLDAWEHLVGPLIEADQRQVMRASQFVHDLSDEVLVLREVFHLEGRPTVLVSLRRFPDADRAFVREHLRPLKVLGTRRDRQDALEIPVTRELTRLLAAYDYRVAPWPNQFHSQSNDVAVIGPPGTGRPRRMFNIELRNRRTEVIDRAKDEHAKAIARVAGRGITTMFVVPRCTRRFRREVEELGGVVVETGVYVTTTEKQRDALASFSWMTLPVELGTNSAPGVVGRIAPVILTPEDRMIRAPHDGATEASDPMNEGDKAEIDRYIALAIQQRQQTAKVRRSAQRVKRAMELYESGVPTVEQAASRIGKIGERQLRRAFEDVGEPLPWGHGGPRQGAGRKSSGHHDRDMPTP